MNGVIAAATHKIKGNQASLKRLAEEAAHLEQQKSQLSETQLTSTKAVMDEFVQFRENFCDLDLVLL